MTISNQDNLTGNLIWFVYIAAIIVSLVGFFITSKLRHDRAVEKFKRSVAIAGRDASSTWPSYEPEEE